MGIAGRVFQFRNVLVDAVANEDGNPASMCGTDCKTTANPIIPVAQQNRCGTEVPH